MCRRNFLVLPKLRWKTEKLFTLASIITKKRWELSRNRREIRLHIFVREPLKDKDRFYHSACEKSEKKKKVFSSGFSFSHKVYNLNLHIFLTFHGWSLYRVEQPKKYIKKSASDKFRIHKLNVFRKTMTAWIFTGKFVIAVNDE